MRLLLKRILDAGYVDISQNEGGVYINGMRADPMQLSITPKGREFVRMIANQQLGEETA